VVLYHNILRQSRTFLYIIFTCKCVFVIHAAAACYGGTFKRQLGGLAMAAPTSSVFSAIYLQYPLYTCIFSILMKYRIIGYLYIYIYIFIHNTF
jgi:hypothetical protein